jgi:hypothetical protein
MAFVIADRVRESSVSTGTGNFTLAGAVTGYQTFASVMATSDTTYYTIADQGGANWEVGIGTFTSPSTLARTTILSSSNGGSVVTFGAGTKDVFISLPASRTNVEDQPNLIEVNSSSAALRITQTGAGNALVVEDSANPDATPFAVDANGVLIVGNTASQGTVPVGDGARYTPQTQIQGSAYGTSALSATLFNSAAAGGGGSLALNKSNTNTLGGQAVVANGDVLGTVFFNGSDGTNFVRGAQILAAVDGTPGTNDMPGRLAFSTTADGASSPTERMRIDNAGRIGIGTTAPTNTSLRISGVQSTSTAYLVDNQFVAQSTNTASVVGFRTVGYTAASSFTLTNMTHFLAEQSTIGAGSALTTQIGFRAGSSLIGATNNYGFFSDIASGANRWNFYAAGTAANYFAGDMQLDKTVTAAGTTGAQTINKNAGTVNFAAAATSLVVTNDRVTANSIVIATVATNDTTMKSVIAVAGAGSFTLTANAAATAETRVNWLVIN